MVDVSLKTKINNYSCPLLSFDQSPTYRFQLPSHMTPIVVVNAFQKLGHHPVSATISKKRKSDDKEQCIVQFANEEAAKQAVIKLNGKQIPSSDVRHLQF